MEKKEHIKEQKHICNPITFEIDERALVMRTAIYILRRFILRLPPIESSNDKVSPNEHVTKCARTGVGDSRLGKLLKKKSSLTFIFFGFPPQQNKNYVKKTFLNLMKKKKRK